MRRSPWSVFLFSLCSLQKHILIFSHISQMKPCLFRRAFPYGPYDGDAICFASSVILPSYRYWWDLLYPASSRFPSWHRLKPYRIWLPSALSARQSAKFPVRSSMWAYWSAGRSPPWRQLTLSRSRNRRDVYKRQAYTLPIGISKKSFHHLLTRGILWILAEVHNSMAT